MSYVTSNNGSGMYAPQTSGYSGQMQMQAPSTPSSSVQQQTMQHHYQHHQQPTSSHNQYMPFGSSSNQLNIPPINDEASSEDSDEEEHVSKVNRAPVCKISKADWTRIYKHIAKREIWNKPSAIFNSLLELGIEVKMKPKAFQAQWNTRRVRLEQFATNYLQERKRMNPASAQYNDMSLKTLKSCPGLHGSMKKFEDPEAALGLGLLIIQRRKTNDHPMIGDVNDMNAAAAAAAAHQLSKKYSKEDARSPTLKPKKDKKEKREKRKHRKSKQAMFSDGLGSEVDSASVGGDDFMASLSPRKRSKSRGGSKKKKSRKSRSSIGLTDSDISSLDSERSSSDSAGFPTSKTDALIQMMGTMNDRFDKLTEAITALVHQQQQK